MKLTYTGWSGAGGERARKIHEENKKKTFGVKLTPIYQGPISGLADALKKFKEGKK
jgi:hypothetical protein